MDVSNSTGQDTSYRVLGGGSGTAPQPARGGRGKEKEKDKKRGEEPEPLPLHTGTLEPNTYVTLPLPEATACRVQFHRAGKLIAEQEVKEGRSEELLVALVPNGKGAPKPYVCRRKA